MNTVAFKKTKYYKLDFLQSLELPYGAVINDGASVTLVFLYQ